MKFIAPARVAIIALVGAVALTGCSYVNPITTDKPYAPADGLQAQIGEVHASNLIIVTTGVDKPASLIGSLYNSGPEDVDIDFSMDRKDLRTVSVPAGAQVQLGIEGDAAVVGVAPVAPGAIANLAIQSDATGVTTTPVPVVDGTQAEFTPEIDLLENTDITKNAS